MYKLIKTLARNSTSTIAIVALIAGSSGAVFGEATMVYAASTPVNITIDKYIDGTQATALSANSASFPMTESGTENTVVFGPTTYALSASNSIPYQATTTGEMTGDNYSTNEVTTGTVVGATCSTGDPFTLVGYTTGTTLAAAQAATPTMTPPTFTNLAGDEYVIVWNQNCAAPTVTSLSPTTGADSGGTSVTITGTGLMGATAVNFGTVAATNVTPVSDTSLTATSPAGTGTVDVTVTTPEGTSATTTADQFMYAAMVNPMTVAATNITSSDATLNGMTGSSASIDHAFWVSTSTFSTASTNMPAGVYTTPNLGAVPANTAFSAQLSSATGLPAVTPNTTYYFTEWSNVGGTWYPGTVLQFTTTNSTVSLAPTVTSVSPITGPPSGGTNVTITGTNFTGATAVNFGTVAATNMTVVSTSTITATSPAMATSTVDVTVMTPIGTSATSTADEFVYASSTGNISGNVGDGVLAVNSIVPVQTNGTADGSFADGWTYDFYITVPTNEPNFSMEFANWMNTTSSSTIPVAGNMEFSSMQANNNDAPILITAANTYSAPLTITSSLDASTTPGYAIEVKVQAAIPVGTQNGSYTTNYGAQTLP